MLCPKKTIAASAATLLLGFGVAACGTSDDSSSTSASSGTTVTTTTTTPDAGPSGGGGPGAGVEVASVSSADELVALIQEAYGEPSLGLHRGHQDVEATLIEVLGISHDEMHVRMETQGQNLAAIAKDVGVDQQKLIDALVETRTSAIDALVESGTINQAEADAYEEKLVDAYTFRVTWDGQAETPTATVV
jgi:hypothetical protein